MIIVQYHLSMTETKKAGRANPEFEHRRLFGFRESAVAAKPPPPDVLSCPVRQTIPFFGVRIHSLPFYRLTDFEDLVYFLCSTHSHQRRSTQSRFNHEPSEDQQLMGSGQRVSKKKQTFLRHWGMENRSEISRVGLSGQLGWSITIQNISQLIILCRPPFTYLLQQSKP